ncbi:MAG TPA: hypothetical protein PKY35_11835 [Candidatus Hydrogenedentes bacterium]|nr:hypothetical protein [Candidatus Hydrogenedentota bacterium]HOL77708.1 hypothetical protein [Candidatus Hydrogenedentota bacterium]HPO86831.1 hypothetical protein [Candidatus Hydrogenedentota bacterium]
MKRFGVIVRQDGGMTRSPFNSLVGSFLLFPLLLLLFAFFESGCGKERTPESLAMPSVTPNAPLTVPLLSLTPEKAVLAMGIPPLNDLAEKTKRFAARVGVLPSGGEPADETNVLFWNEFFEKLSDEHFRSMDIDPTRPLAFFVGDNQMELVVDELLRMLEASEIYNNVTPESAGTHVGEMTNDSVPGQDTSHATFSGMALREMLKKLPCAAVVPCISADKASTVAKRIAAWFGIDMAETTTPMHLENVSISSQIDPVRGSFAGFFVVEDWLFWSNDAELLKGIIDRLKAPLTLRYGTSACPATARDEIVQLVRLDKLGPAIATAIRGTTVSDVSIYSWLEKLARLLENVGNIPASSDALIVSCAYTDERLEFLLRIDASQYTQALEGLGVAKPFEQLRCIPENAEAIVAFHIDPDSKRELELQLDKLLVGGMPTDKEASQTDGLGKVLTSWLGEQVILSAQGFGKAQPAFSLVTMTPYPDAIKGFLAMLGGSVPAVEQYAGAEIYCLEGLPDLGELIAFGIDKNKVFISSDLSTLKTMLDMQSGVVKKDSPLDRLQVSLPPDVGLYSFVMFKDSFLKFVTDLVQATEAGNMGFHTVHLSDVLVLLQMLKCDLYMLNYRDGLWLSSKTVLHLK